MKKRAKTFVFSLLSVFILLLIYNVICVIAIYPEYDGSGGFFGAVSYAEAEIFTNTPDVTFKKTAYRFFGSTLCDGVAGGKNGYLFPTKTDKFDYRADIAGEAQYDEETLSAFYDALLQRKRAYALSGCEFYVFVIPNSQSVLKNELPFDIKDGVTAAEGLSVYLYSRGYEGFYLLGQGFEGAEYQTFDNTENSINGYGAYTVYKNVTEKLPDSIKRRSYTQTLEEDEIIRTVTEGKSLAKTAGIEKLAKNKNVFYDSRRFEETYEKTVRSNLIVCSLKAEYNSFTGTSDVLVQAPDVYERSLLLPLFSSSFTKTVYDGSLSFSSEAVKECSPDVCVCILREDELSLLLDEYDNTTYRTYLLNGEKGGVTDAPQISAVSRKKSRSVIISGTCADNCTVTAQTGENKAETVSSYGIFILELKLSPADKKIRITAKADGKAESDPVYESVPAHVSSETGVFAGALSMLYYNQTIDDFTSNNLLRADGLAKIKERFEKTVAEAREAAGKDTKILFLPVPNPLTVYPEAAAKDLYEQKGSVTRLDQIKTALSDVDGLVFLDVRENMKNNRDLGKLYYQTDTHWTELGAYFGYRALQEEIKKDFPKAEPYPLGSFSKETRQSQSGDLAAFAGMKTVFEQVEYLIPEFRLRAEGVPERTLTVSRSECSDTVISEVNDPELPVAYMLRDSYSAALFPVISEHFSKLYAQKMWDWSFDYDLIAELKPDYIIIVISERNMGVW